MSAPKKKAPDEGAEGNGIDNASVAHQDGGRQAPLGLSKWFNETFPRDKIDDYWNRFENSIRSVPGALRRYLKR